ncbi:hypothetical protein NHQ30_006851 [Ciborinia camelliae]|nr:hypothetical protein NHQ30_006851 [Ciborinia camelliae]
MADMQVSSSAGDAGAGSGAMPEQLRPPSVRCTCVRCIKRVVNDPGAFCVLHPLNPRRPLANVLCTYCHDQRARCLKCPSSIRPQILELQQRADAFLDWQRANDALPPARRLPWVLPVNPPNEYENWPAYTPNAYKALHAAQREVSLAIDRAQRAIVGWGGMTTAQKNAHLRLDPVARNGGEQGYWW